MRNLTPKGLALTAFLAATLLGNAAEPFPKDGSPIVSGIEYTVEPFQDYHATFTPAASGTLVQNGCPDLKLDNSTETFIGWGENGQVYSWTVTGGTTYNITNPVFVLNGGIVSFTMEEDMGMQLTRALPVEGEVISPIVNLTGDVLYYFNTSVIFDQAYLCVGDERIELPNTSFQASTIALNVREALSSLYVNGTLAREGGDPVSIEITGLQSTSGMVYNGDGVLKMNYISSPQLTDLVSTNIPRILKSYYPEGDKEGIWTFVFDRDILDDGKTELTISCGNSESEGMYYYEVLKPTINGATITFNLCDKLRELEDYLMYQGSNYVAVKLSNVRDIDGNLTLGSDDSNVASYNYSLGYNYLPHENIVCEFLPASGTTLQGVKEVEIWYNNADMIEFDGVEFYFNTSEGFKSVVVLKSELDMTVENNEMTILCQVPEAVQGNDQITVRLYNMRSIDGYNYRIEAQYDMFVVDLLSPIKPGQSITSTGTEDFVFKINLTSLYFYLRYDFYNAEGPEGWVYGSELTQQPNGTWTGYNGDFPCYSNFNPYIVVSAYYFEDDYNSGKEAAEIYKFTFVGEAKPFEFSPVKFVSITPEPNEEIIPEDDFFFTVTYDGLVSIDAKASGIMLGMGAGVEPFARVEPIYGEEEYTEGLAPVWRLYPPMWILEDYDAIDISIYAKDEDGAIVEGNLGAGEYDCLQFSYPIYAPSNYLPLTVLPESYSVLDKIEGFTLSYPGLDVGINYSYTGDVSPRLLKDWWDVVAEFKQDDFIAIENNGVYELKLTSPVITEGGSYVLVIPENYLLIGDQFNVSGNEILFAEYTVTGSLSISSIVQSEDTSSLEVYNLQGMRIDSKKLSTGLYIINGQKVYIK